MSAAERKKGKGKNREHLHESAKIFGNSSGLLLLSEVEDICQWPVLPGGAEGLSK